ncbi:MAG TPA: hypothetical protein VKB25_09445 [Conexibacter sp.]|nr:hypothetical protein [Conexibacter sp.]
MSTRASLLALPLGFALALAIAACGSDDAQESSATVVPSPLTSQTMAPTTTAATTTTATTTVPATTTTAPATTTTTPATTPTATQPSGGATTTQPSGGAPAGCPSAIGGFIRDVRATDCGVARSVATAWFAAVRGGAAPDSAVDAAGYSCSGTLAGERASVSCTGSGGSVSFTASP